MFQVQQSALIGNWRTVHRGTEATARDVFQKQLKYHCIGRFRLLDPEGKVIEERKATPLFA